MSWREKIWNSCDNHKTIKVINIDNKVQIEKVQIEKKVRKHENMLPISVCGVICGPSNCGKTNALIRFTGKFTWLIFRECISVLEVITNQNIDIRRIFWHWLKKAVILHFLMIAVVPPNEVETLPNSIFVFDDMACDKLDAIYFENTFREYFAMGRYVDCFYLCQICKDIKASHRR